MLVSSGKGAEGGSWGAKVVDLLDTNKPLAMCRLGVISPPCPGLRETTGRKPQLKFHMLGAKTLTSALVSHLPTLLPKEVEIAIPFQTRVVRDAEERKLTLHNLYGSSILHTKV